MRLLLSNGLVARSFVAATMDKYRAEFRAVAKDMAIKVLRGEKTAEGALDVIGAWAAGKIREEMLRGPHIPPPLEQATKDRKGSDRPLVDTGALAGSVTHEVSM